MKLSQRLEASLDYLMKGDLGENLAGENEQPRSIPPELLAVAGERGWTVTYALGLVRARQAVVGHRNGRARGPFTRSEWEEFETKIGAYLDKDGSK